MKTCSQCKKIKKNSCFNKLSRNTDGLNSKCKDCRAKDTLGYRERKREELRVKAANNRLENPEKVKVAKSAYYQKNKIKLQKKTREWRKNNPGYKPSVESRKNTILKVRFGITLDDYNVMLNSQNGVCAICGGIGAKSLHVDHCHTSGKIRGLLCFRCNNAIGQFDESEVIMFAAISYLRIHK